MHVCTATLSSPNPTTGHHQPMPPLETPGHSWSLGQSLVGSLLLSPGSWCTQGSVCALQESISQSCVSSDSYMVVLMATSSKRAYSIPNSATPRAPAPAAVHIHSRCSKTVMSQFLWVSGSWCTQGLFEPSEHLWWEWGLILNANLPHLPSCWDFSFALGHGISSQSRSSVMQLPLQSLPSGWGFSDLGHGISPHSHSSTVQVSFQCHTVAASARIILLGLL